MQVLSSLYPHQTMEARVNIKALSINEAFKGRRFKTAAYKKYSNIVPLMLPKGIIANPPYKVYYEFGFSNKGSDWDNGIKNFQDILSKKYNFNDNEIYEAHIKKVIVPKGKEYIFFKIESL